MPNVLSKGPVFRHDLSDKTGPSSLLDHDLLDWLIQPSLFWFNQHFYVSNVLSSHFFDNVSLIFIIHFSDIIAIEIQELTCINAPQTCS